MSDLSDLEAIRGAGGKGGGGGGGSESADTLRSTQLADVVDLLGEGEFEGLTNGLRSIYLDGVPLQNADASYNFENVRVYFTPGTQGQASITGPDGVQTEIAVGITVLATTPVVRTITSSQVNAVRVTIAVPQMSKTDTGSGDIGGSAFEWAIDVQSAGGGYVEKVRETVTGKANNRYTRTKKLELTGSAPWDIRVRRITADSASVYDVNAFNWASYSEIRRVKLRHPNSAMVRMLVDARQFNRIPVRAYDVMGARVQVPVNYDSKTKAYTGVWNGTFKTAWTDNPAWVFWAVLTNERYGLGRYFGVPVGATLKWTLYTIGRYCDEMVDDGKGGLEPRFRCGIQLTTREQAYKVLTDLAAVFRGMAYWAASDVGVVQDAPSDPVALFTAANALNGEFTYSGGSRTKRHTQVVVWFNDLSQQGALVPEVVRTPSSRALERKVGIKPLELSPLGIWSRGQAQRLGRWALYSEEFESQTNAFSTGLDGALPLPGQVFAVADPREMGERIAGRVRSATPTAVTLDSPVTLASGESYTLKVMLPDPADPARLVVQERAVANSAGVPSVINLVTAFTAAPAAQSVWMLRSSGNEPTLWRGMGMREADGGQQYELAGVRHYPQKYDLIENGIAFDLPNVSRIKATPDKPQDVEVVETIYMAGATNRSRATVSWIGAPGMVYLVTWRLAAGPWTDMPATTGNTVDIDDLTPGLLEVRVRAVNSIGNRSPWVDASLELTGDATPFIRLVANAGSFFFDVAGDASPSDQVITITATRHNLVAAPTFAAVGYPGAVALTLVGTGDQRRLTVANFGTCDYAKVTATSGTESAEVVIWRTKDGAGRANALVKIFQRATSTPAVPSATVTFTFATGAITGLNNGWSANIPAGTDPLYVTVAPASSTGATDTIATGEWAGPVIESQNGLNTATIFLYQRTSTSSPPSLPSATVTYTFATGGTSGVNNGWSRTLPTTGGEYRWMTTAAALGSGTTDTIASGEWASPSLMAQDGAAGGAGLNSAQVVIYQRAASSPALPSASVTYTFATGGITGLDNGWSASPASGTLPQWVSVASAVSAGASDTIASGEWASPVIQTRDGADGLNTATVYLYQRTSSSSAPSLPSSLVTYTFATAGTTGVDNGWLRSMPTTGGGYRWMTQATALSTASTDTILAGEWATASLMAEDGVSGANGLNTAQVYIYQRSASAPAVPSATVTYTFATGGIAGLNNGWGATIPAGTDPLYVCLATAVSSGTTDTITSGEWAGPVVQARDGAGGAAGLNNATVYLFQRTSSSSAPALPSATVTFTFGTGAASGVNNGWTQSMPTTGGAYRWMTSASALGTGSTDTIASGEWAPAALLAENGAPGSDGKSIYPAKVYLQASSTPSAPTGGSFNFSSNVLTAPSGWSTTQPATSPSLYTYSADYVFSTTTAGATVAGGTWTNIVAIAGGAPPAFTATIGGSVVTSALTNRTVNIANGSVSVSGGVTPYSYSWELIDVVWSDDSAGNQAWLVNATSATPSIKAYAYTTGSVTAAVVCRVIDSNGRIAQSSTVTISTIFV